MSIYFSLLSSSILHFYPHTTKINSYCFLGYNDNHLVFICFDKKSKKIYIARHCKFLKDDYCFKDQVIYSQIATASANINNWLQFPNGSNGPSGGNDIIQDQLPTSPQGQMLKINLVKVFWEIFYN